jgi:hypothetical protein
MEQNKQTEKFKPFWVKEVNNYLCDAGYNGKEFKAANPFPSFRKFWFIRSWEDLRGFTVRQEATNRELCEKWLGIEAAQPTTEESPAASPVQEQEASAPIVEGKHTPGPWIIDRSHKHDREGIQVWSGDNIICDVVDDQHGNKEANAALICEAVNAYPSLVRENAELRKELNDYKGYQFYTSAKIYFRDENILTFNQWIEAGRPE